MSKRVKTVRQEMLEDGGNLGWCVPVWYRDESGKIYAGCRNEGELYFDNDETPPVDAWELFDHQDCACRSCFSFYDCDAMDENCYTEDENGEMVYAYAAA